MKTPEIPLTFEDFIAKYPKARALVFDVDHTITSNATGVRVVMDGLFRGYVKLRTVLTIPKAYYQYKKGTYQTSDVPEVFRDIKGRSKDFLNIWGSRVLNKRILGDVYPAAQLFITKAKEAGLPIVLSSSTFDFIIEPLARYLGVDRWIGTQIAYENGVATGEIVGQPNFRDGKIDRVKDLLGEFSVTLKEAAFFSDSINDLPLLNEVGIPIPTNADKRLSDESLRRGWDLYTFRLKGD